MRIILCLLLSMSFLSPAFSQSAPQQMASEKTMAVLRLMVNKNLMLTFLSHPKTHDYFLKEMKMKADYVFSLKPEVEQLSNQFPTDPLIQSAVQSYLRELNIIALPPLFQEIVLPFLAWGLANTSDVQDPKIVSQIQEFQIELFKNYLCREGVWSGDGNLTKNLKKFSDRCPLPIFSKIIAPILQVALENDGDIDDLVDFYISDGMFEKLSSAQRQELEDIYDPPKYPRFNTENIQIPPIHIEWGDISFNETSSEKSSPGVEALEKFSKKHSKNVFFSQDKLFEVFIEVMLEMYPEQRDTFLRIR